MLLTHISLTNFRNFARLDIDIPGGPVLLVGSNAQGKTSLLEAIYFLATFVSFHATNDRQLINFVTAQEPLAVARIIADFSHSDSKKQIENNTIPSKKHRLEVRLIQEANGYSGVPKLRKEILLDGVKSKMGEAIGAFNAVLFLPQMMRVIEGSPEERRRYLNLAMGQTLPKFAHYLTEYNRALSQRNALLKSLNERGGNADQLDYWDQNLADFGAWLIFERIQAIQQIERLAARVHSELTRSAEVFRLSYDPAFDPLPRPKAQFSLPIDTALDRSSISLDTIRAGFLERLKALRSVEIARGVSTIGPHRDELRFLANGVDLGIYGSRGQGRTAVLSLKLAEAAWMKQVTGDWPVMLLDEVLAELDPERREDLLERILQSEQSLLTTTDLDLFDQGFTKQARIWKISQGRVLQINPSHNSL